MTANGRASSSSLAGAPVPALQEPNLQSHTLEHSSSTPSPPLLAGCRNLPSSTRQGSEAPLPSPASPPSSSSEAPWQGWPNRFRHPDNPERPPVLGAGECLAWSPPVWLWTLQFLFRESTWFEPELGTLAQLWEVKRSHFLVINLKRRTLKAGCLEMGLCLAASVQAKELYPHAGAWLCCTFTSGTPAVLLTGAVATVVLSRKVRDRASSQGRSATKVKGHCFPSPLKWCGH